MEINVTHMVEESDNMIELSASVMELGRDAGKITWGNSVTYGKEHPLLKTEEERDTAREHFRAYGAWSEEEIAAWSEQELQGLMCQEVAAAIREMDDNSENYEEYQKLCEKGTCSGRLYKGDDNHWYFYVGS